MGGQQRIQGQWLGMIAQRAVLHGQGAQFAASYSGQVAASNEAARAAVSGVNLDEEAARLLQYQQAYQAAAKFMQIAQGTFDTLLQTMR